MNRFTDLFQPFNNYVANAFRAKNGWVQRQRILIPILADTDRLKAATATSSSVVTNITTFLAQPDVARNITLLPGGTTADVAAGSYVITGTNIRGEVITDTITIAANASTLQSGTKAFKTVTNVLLPIQDGAAATFEVGVGDVLGLDHCMIGNEVLAATLNGVYETTRPTVVADNDEVEKNTVDINGTLDGAKDVVVVYMTKDTRA